MISSDAACRLFLTLKRIEGTEVREVSINEVMEVLAEVLKRFQRVQPAPGHVRAMGVRWTIIFRSPL